jgi:hypothetical protein
MKSIKIFNILKIDILLTRIWLALKRGNPNAEIKHMIDEADEICKRLVKGHFDRELAARGIRYTIDWRFVFLNYLFIFIVFVYFNLFLW